MVYSNFYPRPPGGGRPATARKKTAALDFYPRPPGGGRPKIMQYLCLLGHFYPRPPGGGRPPSAKTQTRPTHFYPRPPGGGRLRAKRHRQDDHRISIHALRVEGDAKNTKLLQNRHQRFLSTPSGWRATTGRILLIVWRGISIHALRVEGDPLRLPRDGGHYISIHALRVEGDSVCIRAR